MGWEERVDLTPEVLAGKPVVKSTRLSVKLILDLLADDWSTEEVLEQYPTLTRDDVFACLRYASEPSAATSRAEPYQRLRR